MVRKSMIRRPRSASPTKGRRRTSFLDRPWPTREERKTGRRGNADTERAAAVIAAVIAASDAHTQPQGRGWRRRREEPVPDITTMPTLATPREQPVEEPWDRQSASRDGQRAHLLPYKATAVTAAAGGWAWGAGELAETVAGPPGHVLATLGVAGLTASAAGVLRWVHRARIRAGWRRRFWCASVGASAWVTTMSLTGPGWGLLAALGAGATAVSVGWLRAHEVALPGEPGQPAPAVAVTTDVGEFAARWARRVGGNPKLAPDCLLTEGRNFPTRMEFVLQLTQGRTLAQVRDAQNGIASALGLDAMQLTLEPSDVGEHGFADSSRVHLQVIRSSPITRPVYWHGPRFRWDEDGNGRIDLGPYIDGESQAFYELFRPSGMFSGVIIGSTGVGKSSVFNGLVASARSSGVVVTLYFDPKGNSSPDLARHATISEVGLDAAEEFTTAVETLAEWLGKQAAADGRSVFTPTRERPGYLIVIDECDMLFALKGMGDRWGRVAKILRSLGGGLLLATQYAGMKAFGNSELLRSSVRRGNVVLMRTESNTSDNLIAPGMPKSTTLPPKPGYGYVRNDTSRAMALRAAWLLTSDEKVPGSFPPELAGFNADVALSQYPDAPMCPIGTKAMEALARHGSQAERGEARGERLRREIAAFLTGGAGGASGGIGPSRFATDVWDRLAALPGPFADVPDDLGDRSADLSPNQRAVLGALRDGCTRSGDIALRTALAGPAVSKVLTSLAERELAMRVSHGDWAAT